MGQFVDRKTSALMRRLAGREDIVADIEENGDILIEGEYMGRLNGLHVERDPRLKGAPAGTARAAVEKTVAEALRNRAGRNAPPLGMKRSACPRTAILFGKTPKLGGWRLPQFGDKDDKLAYLSPSAVLVADETLTGETRQRAEGATDGMAARQKKSWHRLKTCKRPTAFKVWPAVWLFKC